MTIFKQILCSLGLHKWPMWSDPQKLTPHSYSQQKRCCSRCNRESIRTYNT